MVPRGWNRCWCFALVRQQRWHERNKSTLVKLALRKEAITLNQRGDWYGSSWLLGLGLMVDP